MVVVSIKMGHHIHQKFGISENLSGNLFLLLVAYIYFARLEDNRFFFKDIFRVNDLRKAINISVISFLILIAVKWLRYSYLPEVVTFNNKFNCLENFAGLFSQVASRLSSIVVDLGILQGIFCILLISKFGKGIGIFFTISLWSFFYSFTPDGPNVLEFGHNFISISIYVYIFLRTSSVVPGIILGVIYSAFAIVSTCTN